MPFFKLIFLVTALGLPIAKVLEIGMPARWSWLAVTAPLWIWLGLVVLAKGTLVLLNALAARRKMKKNPDLSFREAYDKVYEEDKAQRRLDALVKQYEVP